jgi:hypothetical protein
VRAQPSPFRCHTPPARKPIRGILNAKAAKNAKASSLDEFLAASAFLALTKCRYTVGIQSAIRRRIHVEGQSQERRGWHPGPVQRGTAPAATTKRPPASVTLQNPRKRCVKPVRGSIYF